MLRKSNNNNNNNNNKVFDAQLPTTFQTPKTNEAQLKHSTPEDEDVLIIKSTQDTKEENNDNNNKKDKEDEKTAALKNKKQALREQHQKRTTTTAAAATIVKTTPLPPRKPPPPPTTTDNNDNDNNNKPLREIKCQEVVRGKEARKELVGYACSECERFYAVAGQFDRRACGHTGSVDNNNGASRNIENSRHRAKYVPPKDPVGYWDLGGFTQDPPPPAAASKKNTNTNMNPSSQENLSF